jgi:OmpR-family two-component system manganese-sensing sensor histidine kinase
MKIPIFRRIGYAIALQFTAFVFGLLLVTGTVFLAADVYHRNRETHARLERQLVQILDRPEKFDTVPALPAYQRERIRITDASGNTLFSGTLYEDIPFTPDREIMTVERGRESYDILTAPFTEKGKIVGYLQVADRSPPDDLEARVFLFLIVSAGISGLTFGVGLFFARRSLRPAEQMMRRLEQFTSDASHEMRTPLTAIGTSLDLALQKADNKDLIASAKRDLKNMGTLVERLLELARLDAFALKTERVDMSTLVKDVVTKHEPAAKEKQVVIATVITSGVSIDADAALARQVVSNLVANAIKFNKPGGSVTVTLTKNALTVVDTGKGIAQESIDRIFDRFFQEDDARTTGNRGLGLGLALSKRIADLHGWALSVRSKAGKGSEFTVRF